MKKASTPPAPSNIPVNLAESKVTPPPTGNVEFSQNNHSFPVGSPVQTLAMKKYHAMTSTSSQSQLSAGQFLKKTTPEVTSPPAKRVFYCDPNNPTVATLQPAGTYSLLFLLIPAFQNLSQSKKLHQLVLALLLLKSRPMVCSLQFPYLFLPESVKIPIDPTSFNKV